MPFETAERLIRNKTPYEYDQSTSVSKNISTHRKIEDSARFKYKSSMAMLES